MPDTNLLDEKSIDTKIPSSTKSMDKPDLVDQMDNARKLNLVLDSLYAKTEQNLNKQFDLVKMSLELRQNSLLDELKKYYTKMQNVINNLKNDESFNNLNYSSILSSIEQLDFSSNLNSSDTSKTSDINEIIKSYGKIISSDSNEAALNAIECIINGKGLSECYVNEEASFILSFKNRDMPNFTKANVSFLDIFIVTSEGETSWTSNSLNSDLIDKENSLNLTKNKSSQPSVTLYTPKQRSQSAQKLQLNQKSKSRPNSDCKLECLADGLYTVKYKLDKSGTYKLNILVNKKHIGQSPYILKCAPMHTKPKIELKKKPSMKSSQTFNISTNSLNGGSVSPPKSSTARPMKTSSSSHILNTLSTNSSLSKTFNSSNGLPSASSSFLASKFVYNNQSNISLVSNLTNSKSSPNSSSYSLSEAFLGSPRIRPIGSSTAENKSDFICDEKIQDDFLFKIGSHGRGAAEFMNPQAVCANEHYIYITDSNNQKIDVFTHDGEYKFSLGSNLPSNSRGIRRPIGITTGVGQKILVVDYEHKCVNVFEESGKFVSKICQNRLLGPKGICVNKACNNQIIVADSKANTVCIFDNEGRFLHKFGNLGNKNENFAGPHYVACLSNGDIVVTDFYNHCIKVFDPKGSFKFSFGSNGSNQGQFNGPTGVAVDKSDNIVVVDWGNSRVQLFDKHGTFIRFINSDSTPLYGPQDVTIINDKIAVADSGNHCLKLYDYSNSNNS